MNILCTNFLLVADKKEWFLSKNANEYYFTNIFVKKTIGNKILFPIISFLKAKLRKKILIIVDRIIDILEICNLKLNSLFV